MFVQYLGKEGRLGAATQIPTEVQAAMERYTANFALVENQHLVDLDSLSQLYLLNSKKTDQSNKSALLERLSKSITKQILKSNLFAPSPKLKSLLFQKRRMELDRDST